MLGWLTGRRGRREKTALTEWRKAWAAAAEAPDAARVAELRRSLDALGAAGDDLEIELEMVDGLAELVSLTARLRNGDVPVVQTGHRVRRVRRLPFQLRLLRCLTIRRSRAAA